MLSRFSVLRKRLAMQLEEVTEEYSYLQLDSQKDYYNFGYIDRTRVGDFENLRNK